LFEEAKSSPAKTSHIPVCHQHHRARDAAGQWSLQRKVLMISRRIIQLILKAKPPTVFARKAGACSNRAIHLLHAARLETFDRKARRQESCVHRVRRRRPRTDFSLGRLPGFYNVGRKMAGRFITSCPNVHTKDPASGARHLGMYRMQIFGRTNHCDALADS
jgi:UbiD family decarboxylase